MLAAPNSGPVLSITASMTSVAENLQAVHLRIARACLAAGRDPLSVQLLAVSKTFPASAVRTAHLAGQNAFGESYVQEALAKQAELGALGTSLCWHHIGPIQSNKTREIASHFAWVHGVERLKIAQRLSEQRAETLPALNVLVQVNISGEASKSGCAPEETLGLCAEIARLPRLQLRGLMAVPAPSDQPTEQVAAFARLQALFLQVRAQWPQADTLSAGMSDDLEAAVAQGSTLVRIGTAIFGSRPRTSVAAP